MAYVITRKCERAGLCADVCPTDSIHWVDDDPEWPTYYINPDTCIECGACEAECPNEAIFTKTTCPRNTKTISGATRSILRADRAPTRFKLNNRGKVQTKGGEPYGNENH